MKYTTSLETLQFSVGEILDEKLKATSPAQTVDYVAFACDNLSSNIERAKEAKRELDEYIKNQTSILDTVKTDTAKWFEASGIDKIEGIRVSSITTYDTKPKEKLIIHDSQYWKTFKETMKVSIDELAVKNFLKKDNNMEIYSEFAEIETTHGESMIKINKRKK